MSKTDDTLNDGSMDLSQLRNLVRQYVDYHMYDSALFWADKICTLSSNNQQDVLWFAHILYLTQQYLRAAHVLKSNGLSSTNAVAKYLAAKCYYECKDWRSALEILEDNTDNLRNNTFSDIAVLPPSLKGNRKIESATALLRGKIYKVYGIHDIAIQCLKEALQCDVFCYEAFDILISHHAMTATEEIELINSLPFSQQCSEEEAQLVRFSYECKINKYGKRMETKLPAHLECLHQNLNHISCLAERSFNCCNYREAFEYTSSVIKADPLHEAILPVHISCLFELKRRNEIFILGQKLVDIYPCKAVSWYAVGSYYLLIEKNEQARKYFSKATSINENFGPAWLGFAHSYASEGERDQAISAYYSASKLMPGSHLPFLYLGVEYALSNNSKLASNFFKEALLIAPDDPHIKHEMGCLAYQNGNYSQAEAYFLTTLKKLEESKEYDESDLWEPLHNNLGHICRKLEKYEEAIGYHENSLSWHPKNAAAYSSIGLCYLFQGKDEKAIPMFHKALSIRRDDTISIQLLELALNNLCTSQNISGNPVDKTGVFEGLGGIKSNLNSMTELSCNSDNSTLNNEVEKDESELSAIVPTDSSAMSIEDF